MIYQRTIKIKPVDVKDNVYMYIDFSKEVNNKDLNLKLKIT